jgi:glycosyltransferase involved in cell wall biosynthesis
VEKLISVIVPVFNGAEFIHSCIESVLKQSENNFELLIINDGSTDHSEEIILSFSDPRIRYVKQDNQGVAITRNRAINMAKGNFIVFQDADDISVPSRFEILKRHFISDSVGLVHSDVLLIDIDDRPVGYYSNRNLDKTRALRYFFKIGTPICGGSVMARREVFRDVRYDSSLSIGEDNDILSRITQVWDSVHVPEPLYLYRRHGFNSVRETRYDAVFAHVQKFLEEYSLQELIPELDWDNGEHRNNEARALGIISLFLHRRGMYLHVENWRKTAEERASEADTMQFIEGITYMIEGDYSQALIAFQLCKTNDHILEN